MAPPAIAGIKAWVAEECSAKCPRRKGRDMLASGFGFSRAFEHVPGGVGQVHEVIEFARPAQPQAAVDHYAFAVHVVGLFAQKTDREVGQLLMATDSFHRMMIFCA